MADQILNGNAKTAPTDPFVTETGLGIQGNENVSSNTAPDIVPEAAPELPVEAQAATAAPAFDTEMGSGLSGFDQFVTTPLDVDDLMYQTLSTPPSTPDPKFEAITRIKGLIADPTVGPDEFVEQFKNINAGLVEQDVKRSLRKGFATVESLLASAKEAEDVVYKNIPAAVFALNATEEEAEDRSPQDVVASRLQKNREEFNRVFLDATFAVSKSLEETDAKDAITVFGRKFTPNMVLKGLDDMVFSVVATQSIIGSMSNVFPELDDPKKLGIPRLSVGSVFRYVADQIKNAQTPEQARGLTLRIVEELKKNAGALTDGNEFTVMRALDALRDRIVGDAGAVTDTVDNVFGLLEIVPIVGTAKNAAKSAVNKGSDLFLEANGISVKIPYGSPADVATMTGKGSKKLLDAVNTDEELLKSAGTTAAEVIGSLGLPKVGQFLDSGVVIDPTFISKDAVQERITKMIGIANRPTQSVFVKYNDEAGFAEFDYTYGTVNGSSFKTEADAITALKKLGRDDLTIVGDKSTGFLIKGSGKTNYTLQDVGAINPSTEIIRTGVIAEFLGKAVQFSARFAGSSTDAALRSARAKEKVTSLVNPFLSLGRKSQEKVANKLRDGDIFVNKDGTDVGKTFTKQELTESGFTPEEIAGYFSVRKLYDLEREVKNSELVRKLTDEGFVDVDIGEVGSIGKKVTRNELDDAKTFYDAETKSYMKFTPGTLGDEAYVFYRVKGDGIKSTYARIPVTSEANYVGKRPITTVLRKVDGYMKRIYSNPYYVREMFDEGGSAAVVVAGSQKEAKELIERLKAENPGKNYEFRASQESANALNSWDEIEAAADQGLLAYNKRRPTPLRDAAGNLALQSPEASIRASIQSTADAFGIKRWVDASAEAYNKTFGKEFGEFKLGGKPLFSSLKGGDTNKRFQQAMTLHTHINMVAGATEQQVRSKLLAGIINVAEKTNNLFSNFGGPGRALGKAVETTVTGQSTELQRLLTTSIFMVNIGTNPARALISQLTMMTQFLGTPIGAKYMLSPTGFMRDFTALSVLTMEKVLRGTAKLAGADIASQAKGDAVRKALGISKDKMYALTEGYKLTGLRQLIDDDVFVAGTYFDSPISKTGLVSRAAGDVGRAVASGFKYGSILEKRTAFLFAYEQYKKNFGRLPGEGVDEDWIQVGRIAENFGMNQNRSDKIPFSAGIFGSLITQFMSHSLKVSARLMTLENTLSRTTQAGMAAALVATWGLDGMGAGQLSNMLADAVSEEFFDGQAAPEDVKDWIREGVNGFLINSLFEAASGSEEVDADFKNIAPLSGGLFGVLTPDTIARYFIGATTLGEAGTMLLKDLVTPAAGGTVESLIRIGKFASAVSGNSALTTPEKIRASLTAAATMFPAMNNGLKAWIALETGFKVDSFGRPSIEVSRGEAGMLGLFGIPTKEEADIRFAKDIAYASMNESGAGNTGEAAKKGKEFATEVVIPLLNNYLRKERSMTEVMDILDGFNHAISYKNEYDRDVFKNAMVREVMKSDTLTSDAYRERLVEDIYGGRKPMDERVIREVNLAGFSAEQKRDILRYINRQLSYTE